MNHYGGIVDIRGGRFNVPEEYISLPLIKINREDPHVLSMAGVTDKEGKGDDGVGDNGTESVIALGVISDHKPDLRLPFAWETVVAINVQALHPLADRKEWRAVLETTQFAKDRGLFVVESDHHGIDITESRRVNVVVRNLCPFTKNKGQDGKELFQQHLSPGMPLVQFRFVVKEKLSRA